MRHLILFVLLLPFMLLAQLPLHVSGQFNSENRILRLGDEAQRHLFIKEKGNLDLPEFGYFLELSEPDAKKLGQSYIGVIFLNELDNQDIASNYDQVTIHLEILPIGNDQQIYYCKNFNYFNLSNHLTEETKVLPRSNFRKNFFLNPTKKDTISWNDVTTYQYLRHTKEWISKLNSQQEVVVEYTGYAERTDGSEITRLSYESESMAKLARQQLHYVENLMSPLFPPSADSGSQLQWQKWFDSTIAINNTVVVCNARNWNETLNSRDFGIFNTDAITNVIYRMEQVPGYEDYSNQQVLAFNAKSTNFYRRNIYSDKQQQANSAELFECINDTIYLLNQYFKWAKFKLGADKGKENRWYEFLQEKSILPDAMLSNGQRYYVDQSYTTVDFIFVAIHEEKTKAVFLLCIETQTGKVVSMVELEVALKKTKLKYANPMQVIRVTNGNKNHNDFILSLKSDTSNFILKLNSKLEVVAASQLEPIKTDFTVIQKDNTTLLVILNDYNIRTLILDEKLNLINSIVNQLPDGYSENALFVEDGYNIRTIVKYDDALYSGIKSAIINKDFKISTTKCVYTFAPIEEKSENTALKLQYLTKTNGKWYVFFKQEDQLRVLEVPY
jgi:hypothetical protein